MIRTHWYCKCQSLLWPVHPIMQRHSILQYEIHWHLHLKKNHLRFTKMRGFVVTWVIWEKKNLSWSGEETVVSDEEWRWQLYCQVSSVHSLQGLGSLIVFPHLIATIITFITFITICINSQESVMERLGLLTPSSTTPILISRKHLECWEDQNLIFISFKI